MTHTIFFRLAVVALVVAVLAACSPPAAVRPTAPPVAAPTAAAPTAPPPTPAPARSAVLPITKAQCPNVERVSTLTDEANALGQALVAALPAQTQNQPSVELRQIRQIDRLGDWVLIETSFLSSEPGIFALRREGETYKYVTAWGGVAESAAQIRAYLAQNAPDAPKELIDCFEPASPPFAPLPDEAFCANVTKLPPDSDEAKAIAASIAAADPSLGQPEEIRAVQRLDTWVLIELRFSQSEPGILLLEAGRDGSYRRAGSWGGVTESTLQIRRALAEQVPQVPPLLLACLMPQGAPFVREE